jgi:Xaa-Pro dipeptidase
LEVAHCRGRQRRLLDVMARDRLDLIVVCRHEHVQWLTGPRFASLYEPAVALTANGHCLLVAPDTLETIVAADAIVGYEASRHATLRTDQRQACADVLLRQLALRSNARRVGVEFASFPSCLSTRMECEFVDIDPMMFRLRRRKDPDELALLKRAIQATSTMYAKARDMIQPGVRELDVFRELQSVAVESLAEMSTVTGNDFQCGTSGGPPRNRPAVDGELYILDLGIPFRGYFADNCRTVAVNGHPTDEQLGAWEKIVGILTLVEQTVKPGVSCRGLFHMAQAQLDEYRAGSFSHHLGHGIGLYPHEAPHLNPHWDDVFEVGDVFTAEPGLYAPDLAGGIRLENDYVVTDTGVELLSDFPLHL